MGNKSKSSGAQAQSSNYKTSKRWETNRKRKLLRALKRNPGNAEQINAAMGNIRYRRKPPTNRFWSSTRRQQAELFKLVQGAVNMDMFSNNEKVSGPAIMLHGKHKLQKFQGFSENTMFSIGVRARVYAQVAQ